MSRVLLIEDDPAIARAIVDNLRFEGYEALTASEGRAGLELARAARPDLILLDLMLPRMSGYEVCRQLRAEGIATPIIILSARGEETDRILGLDLGADDYVTKPFGIRELVARVRAVLRRANGDAAQPATLRFDDVVVDFRAHTVHRGGEPLELTRKEMALLRYLAAHEGVTVRRERLLDEVWGYGVDTTTRTVDNHVAALRAKLERDPRHPRRLVTVHGVGYRWDG